MGNMSFSQKNMVVHSHTYVKKSPEVGHGDTQETANDLVQDSDSGHGFAAIASQFDSGDHSGLNMQMFPDVFPSDATSGAHMSASANISVVSDKNNGKHQSTLASHSHQCQDDEQSESESESEDEGLHQVDGGNDTDNEHSDQTGIGRSPVQGLAALSANRQLGPSASSTPAPHNSMNRVHQRIRSNSGQTWTESMNQALTLNPTPTQPPRPGCYSDGYSSQHYRTVPRYAYGYSEGMQPIWYDQSAMTAMDPGYFHRNMPQPQLPSHPFFQSGYVSQSPVSPGQYYGWPPWMLSYLPHPPPPLPQPAPQPAPPRGYYPTSTPTPARFQCPSASSNLLPPPPPPVLHPAYAAPALHRPPPMPLRRDGPTDAKEVTPSRALPALSAQEKEKREKQFREAARDKLKRDAELDKKTEHKQKREKQFRDAVLERIQRVEELEREAAVEAKDKAKKAEEDAKRAAEATKKAEEEARAKAEKEAREARERAEKEEEEARKKEEARVAKEKAGILRAQARARANREKEQKEKAEKEKTEREARYKAKTAEINKYVQLKAKERFMRLVEAEERLKKEKKHDEMAGFEAFVKDMLQQTHTTSHGSSEKSKPASSRQLRYEDFFKASFPELPNRASTQKAPEKGKPSHVKNSRYEDFLKTRAPAHENKLAHDIKKFVELTEPNKKTNGKLNTLRNGSEPDYSLSRETNTVIGTGRPVKPTSALAPAKAPKPTFPEPKKTLEQRLEEADAWFHKDGREEPLFRNKVTALAKRHVTSNDEDDDEDKNDEKEGPSDENSAKNHREKEMIVLVGDAIASLGAYVSERDDGKRPGYFSEFRDVHRRFCSTAARPYGGVSYFERGPLDAARSAARTSAGNSIGPGSAITSTSSAITGTGSVGNSAGRIGRGTAGATGIGAAGAGAGSIGSSRGNQHRRARANAEKVYLIKPRRPEL